MAIAPIIPWEPCNIPTVIQDELNRRKFNRSFTYVDPTTGGWDESSGTPGDWRSYKGPMSPWVRFCSNGYGREFNKHGKKLEESQIKPGFVFFGGKNFYEGYGFSNTNNTPESIIGYLPDGIRTHVIDNNIKTSDSPIHVPPPEIEKISATIQKELYRRVTIEWVCFSKSQLEYMTPYFLVPGISCIIEWGWNHFNPSCLLDLTNMTQLKEFNNNPYPLYNEHIIPSKGNYDVLFGRITHFEWSAEGNKFKCKTEITSQDRIYAGLVVDAIPSNKIENSKGDEEDIRPFGSLMEFVNKKLPLFRKIGSADDPASIPELTDVVNYIKKHFPFPAPKTRPSAYTWKDYIYGVFYGRDADDPKGVTTDDNKKEDFDRKNQKETWLNLGLVMEIINYHISPLKSFKQDEIFRVDIDDVVITGHPNLISNDGGVLLIPNAESPKYFSGKYGLSGAAHVAQTNEELTKLRGDFLVMKNSNPLIPIKDFNTSESRGGNRGGLADYRLYKICGQTGGAYRDNHDELINRIRYENTTTKCEFPFYSDRPVEKGSKPYPARYSGYLKDLYINVGFLERLIKDTSIKTYVQLIDRMLTEISNAAGGFWDFQLVSGTGRAGQVKGEPATMKIVDYRFMNMANTGVPYTFDYFDSDSLLMGLTFRPTLSNTQTARAMFAQTNQPDKNVTVTNGDNELLDYKFRDRLVKDDDDKTASPPALGNTLFADTMRPLQQIRPCDKSYQMTMRVNGKIVIRRLALPNSSDVLKLLLDDGDEEFNPKYTGIMPGLQSTFTIQGIGGLRTFMMFLVRNLPEPYSHENIVFRIVDVQDSIEAGKWTTTITAGIIPLRENIRARLGIPAKTN